MRRTIHQTILGAVVALALSVGSSAFAAMPISGPTQINTPGSYVLTASFSATLGADGIIINADHVTLDLNGKTISNASNPGSAGVRIKAGKQWVTVRNGTITNCYFGVFLEGNNSAILVERLKLNNNTRGGIMDGIFDAVCLAPGPTSWSTFRYNKVTVTNGMGIGIGLGGDHIDICNNDITGTGNCGIQLYGQKHKVVCNVVTKSASNCGIICFDVSDSQLTANVCTQNFEDGILLQGLGAFGNNGSDRNLLTRNKCTGNGFSGISLHIGSTQNRLEGNFATGNSLFDLTDLNLPGTPCPNTWVRNFFKTDNELDGPAGGCIR